MRRFLFLLTLLVAPMSGCIVSNPGSQAVEIAPWGIRPAHEESNRAWRQATGDPNWRHSY